MGVRRWSVSAFVSGVLAAVAVVGIELFTALTINGDSTSALDASDLPAVALELVTTPIVVVFTVVPVVVTALAAFASPPYDFALAFVAAAVLAGLAATVVIGLLYLPALVLTIVAIVLRLRVKRSAHPVS